MATAGLRNTNPGTRTPRQNLGTVHASAGGPKAYRLLRVACGATLSAPRSTWRTLRRPQFLPNDIRRDRQVLITDAAFGALPDGVSFEGVLRHELGHTLGVRHEPIWLDRPCTPEPSDDARQVTVFDEDSVMHYPWCRTPAGGGLRQTDLDYRGAINLYGLAPRLIASAAL